MLINQDYAVLYPIVQKTSDYMSDNSMEFRENLGEGERGKSNDSLGHS